MTLDHVRDFELPPGTVWFNGGYESPTPRVARAAVEEGYRIKADPTTQPFDTVYALPDAIRERLGILLGLSAADFGITTGTATGAMMVAQGMHWAPGDRVLVGPDEYPGNVYPWLALEARGVSVEIIGRSGHALDLQELERALTRPGRVRLLSVAAVHYFTGTVHPLAEFAALLHRHEALLAIDASQAAGAIALDWAAVDADIVLISGYKWLLGPYGTGALWVRPALRDALVPVNGNWWGLVAAPDMNTVMREHPRVFRPHGVVLDVSQSASFLNLSAWRAGLDYLRGVGVAAAEAHHRALQDRIVAALAGMPLVPAGRLDTPHRSPMLMLLPGEGVDMTKLVADLAARRVFVSARSGRMRVTPGLWSAPAEVDAFVEAVTGSLSQARAV